MKSRAFQGLFVTVGALVLSTLGIFASDALNGVDSRINLAGIGASGACPRGMIEFKSAEGLLCVDIYEASVGESCPNQNPRNVIESEKNAGTKGCYAASEEGKTPWTYVTLAQAQRICAESGKRLPRSDEWYALALGTREDSCTIQGTEPGVTGTDQCRSSAGVSDMVGNVWEWVNETVEGAAYNGRALPSEGYVTEADAAGIAIATDPGTGSELYSSDYFWSKGEGTFGMIRGGFYGSGSDAGLYTVNASVPPNFATQGVGFRCVQDVL